MGVLSVAVVAAGVLGIGSFVSPGVNLLQSYFHYMYQLRGKNPE